MQEAHGRAQHPRRHTDDGAPQLEIVEERLDSLPVLRVTGPLDMASTPALCVRLDAARRSSGAAVLLDLSELDFCDSSGLRALIGEAREYAIAGGELAVVRPNGGAAARLFALAGAEEFLPLYASRDAVARARRRRSA